jgi:hypothetical protein
MSAWNDMPKKISHATVLRTIDYDGMDKWRNPVRLEIHDSWPAPRSERQKEYTRILGMEKSITGKSPI